MYIKSELSYVINTFIRFAIKSFSWSNHLSMKKFLIVIGNAGGGHIACARATKDSIKRIKPESEVRIVDLFEFSRFTSHYDYFYFLISRYKFLEFVYNVFYWLINEYPIASDLATFFTVRILYSPTIKLLDEYKPDYVICNNGLASKVLNRCKRDRNFRYVVTVPDLISVARWFADSKADLIFSPTKEALLRLKIFCPECNVISSYYPLRHVNRYSQKDTVGLREHLFKNFSFDINRPTLLITGCGDGTRRIIAKLKSLIKSDKYQFIIMSGKDRELRDKLGENFCKRDNVYIQEYTTKILDFFAVSDLIIAKPGPATLLEIEKLGKKAIFTTPVGYQEFGNVEYILRNPNFIYVGDHFDNIPKEIEDLLAKAPVKNDSLVNDSDAIVKRIFKDLSLNKS